MRVVRLVGSDQLVPNERTLVWHGTFVQVRWNEGLANGLESVVECDGAMRSMPVERQSEENLLWHSLKHQFRHILEPEFPVVIRMSNKTTTLSIHILQP